MNIERSVSTSTDSFSTMKFMVLLAGITSCLALNPFKNIDSAKSANEIYGKSELETEWAKCVIAAPTVVTLMGQLMVISTKVDFPMVNNVNVSKLIKHPESFRMTLVQIAHECFDAFDLAHSSMTAIKLRMKSMPNSIRTLRRLMEHSNPKAQKKVPRYLLVIGRLASETAAASKRTYRGFLKMKLLISTVAEVTVLAGSQHDDKRRQIQQQIAVTESVMENMDNVIANQTQFMKDQYAEIELRRANVLWQLNDLPEGLRAMLEPVFADFADSPRAPVHEVESTASFQLSTVIYPIAKKIEHVACMIDVHFKLDELVGDCGLFVSPVKYIEGFSYAIGTGIGIMQDMPESEQKSITVFALNKLADDIKVVVDLVKAKAAGTFNDQTDIVIARQSSIKTFLTTIGPILTEAAENGGLISAMVESSEGTSNGQFKLDLERELLLAAENRYNMQFHNLMRFQEQMIGLITRLGGMNVAALSQQEIVLILMNSTSVLGNITEQWSQLVQFTNVLTNHVEIGLQQDILPRFNRTALRLNMTKPAHKKIFEAAALKIFLKTEILTMVAESYLEMSNKYIIPPLAGITNLLSANSDAARSKKLQELVSTEMQNQSELKIWIKAKKNSFGALISKARAGLGR